MAALTSPQTRSPWPGVLASVVLVAAVALVYRNILGSPFVFDDIQSIVENPTIRHLDTGVGSPPSGATVSGRPLVNLTLALNYAAGGEDVYGYHLANVGIHTLASLSLFGLLCRTFASPRLRASLGDHATELAFAVALLWALHPLQTQSVTYVIQRAESLMGFFYLSTLYCFARATETVSSAIPSSFHFSGFIWLGTSVAACALGMATKEVMVSAPLAVLLFDRVFIAASFRELWRARRWYYLALSATWLLLAFLVWHSGNRAGTAGFSIGISPLDYALTQCRAIALYLRLTLWPHPLVFDYGEYEALAKLALLPFGALIVALLGGTFWLWRRFPPAGFAAVLFFLVLAPTSSVLPIFTEPIAEHRMYLPLAPLMALTAGFLYTLAGRWSVALLLILAPIAALGTFQRNDDYRSARALWEATVEAVPHNVRAHSSLAALLAKQREWPEAETHFNAAVALRPDYVAARAGLVDLLAEQRRWPEAEAQCQAILRLHPADALAHNALGTVHYAQGRLDVAVGDFEHAIQNRPDFAAAHNNLGGVLYERGEFSTARAHLETALRLRSEYAEAHYNLGNVLVRQNHLRDAQREYEDALRLAPEYAEAHAHLGVVLQNLGESAPALRHHREALRLRPDFEFVRENIRALGATP